MAQNNTCNLIKVEGKSFGDIESIFNQELDKCANLSSTEKSVKTANEYIGYFSIVTSILQMFLRAQTAQSKCPVNSMKIMSVISTITLLAQLYALFESIHQMIIYEKAKKEGKDKYLDALKEILKSEYRNTKAMLVIDYIGLIGSIISLVFAIAETYTPVGQIVCPVGKPLSFYNKKHSEKSHFLLSLFSKAYARDDDINSMEKIIINDFLGGDIYLAVGRFSDKSSNLDELAKKRIIEKLYGSAQQNDKIKLKNFFGLMESNDKKLILDTIYSDRYDHNKSEIVRLLNSIESDYDRKILLKSIDTETQKKWFLAFHKNDKELFFKLLPTNSKSAILTGDFISDNQKLVLLETIPKEEQGKVLAQIGTKEAIKIFKKLDGGTKKNPGKKNQFFKLLSKEDQSRIISDNSIDFATRKRLFKYDIDDQDKKRVIGLLSDKDVFQLFTQASKNKNNQFASILSESLDPQRKVKIEQMAILANERERNLSLTQIKEKQEIDHADKTKSKLDMLDEDIAKIEEKKNEIARKKGVISASDPSSLNEILKLKQNIDQKRAQNTLLKKLNQQHLMLIDLQEEELKKASDKNPRSKQALKLLERKKINISNEISVLNDESRSMQRALAKLSKQESSALEKFHRLSASDQTSLTETEQSIKDTDKRLVTTNKEIGRIKSKLDDMSRIDKMLGQSYQLKEDLKKLSQEKDNLEKQRKIDLEKKLTLYGQMNKEIVAKKETAPINNQGDIETLEDLKKFKENLHADSKKVSKRPKQNATVKPLVDIPLPQKKLSTEPQKNTSIDDFISELDKDKLRLKKFTKHEKKIPVPVKKTEHATKGNIKSQLTFLDKELIKLENEKRKITYNYEGDRKELSSSASLDEILDSKNIIDQKRAKNTLLKKLNQQHLTLIDLQEEEVKKLPENDPSKEKSLAVLEKKKQSLLNEKKDIVNDGRSLQQTLTKLRKQENSALDKFHRLSASDQISLTETEQSIKNTDKRLVSTNKEIGQIKSKLDDMSRIDKMLGQSYQLEEDLKKLSQEKENLERQRKIDLEKKGTLYGRMNKEIVAKKEAASTKIERPPTNNQKDIETLEDLKRFKENLHANSKKASKRPIQNTTVKAIVDKPLSQKKLSTEPQKDISIDDFISELDKDKLRLKKFTKHEKKKPELITKEHATNKKLQTAPPKDLKHHRPAPLPPKEIKTKIVSPNAEIQSDHKKKAHHRAAPPPPKVAKLKESKGKKSNLASPFAEMRRDRKEKAHHRAAPPPPKVAKLKETKGKKSNLASPFAEMRRDRKEKTHHRAAPPPPKVTKLKESNGKKSDLASHLTELQKDHKKKAHHRPAPPPPDKSGSSWKDNNYQMELDKLEKTISKISMEEDYSPKGPKEKKQQSKPLESKIGPTSPDVFADAFKELNNLDKVIEVAERTVSEKKSQMKKSNLQAQLDELDRILNKSSSSKQDPPLLPKRQSPKQLTKIEKKHHRPAPPPPPLKEGLKSLRVLDDALRIELSMKNRAGQLKKVKKYQLKELEKKIAKTTNRTKLKQLYQQKAKLRKSFQTNSSIEVESGDKIAKLREEIRIKRRNIELLDRTDKSKYFQNQSDLRLAENKMNIIDRKLVAQEKKGQVKRFLNRDKIKKLNSQRNNLQKHRKKLISKELANDQKAQDNSKYSLRSIDESISKEKLRIKKSNEMIQQNKVKMARMDKDTKRLKEKRKFWNKKGTDKKLKSINNKKMKMERDNKIMLSLQKEGQANLVDLEQIRKRKTDQLSILNFNDQVDLFRNEEKITRTDIDLYKMKKKIADQKVKLRKSNVLNRSMRKNEMKTLKSEANNLVQLRKQLIDKEKTYYQKDNKSPAQKSKTSNRITGRDLASAQNKKGNDKWEKISKKTSYGGFFVQVANTAMQCGKQFDKISTSTAQGNTEVQKERKHALSSCALGIFTLVLGGVPIFGATLMKKMPFLKKLMFGNGWTRVKFEIVMLGVSIASLILSHKTLDILEKRMKKIDQLKLADKDIERYFKAKFETLSNLNIFSKTLFIDDLIAADTGEGKFCISRSKKIDVHCNCRKNNSCLKITPKMIPKEFIQSKNIQKSISLINSIAAGKIAINKTQETSKKLATNLLGMLNQIKEKANKNDNKMLKIWKLLDKVGRKFSTTLGQTAMSSDIQGLEVFKGVTSPLVLYNYMQNKDLKLDKEHIVQETLNLEEEEIKDIYSDKQQITRNISSENEEESDYMDNNYKYNASIVTNKRKSLWQILSIEYIRFYEKVYHE